MTLYPAPPRAGWTPSRGGSSGPRAGFWRRFVGLLADSVALYFVWLILRKTIGPVTGAVVVGPIWLVYATVTIGSRRGQTLGKLATGIRVIDFDTGGSIGYRRAFIRGLVGIVSGLALFVGCLWMLRDSEKRCWHDKAANDVVVPVQYYPFKR